ncbi:MAG TPA: hypothetical protein VJ785_18195 [Anaerolineales bacterium]|nr:hypothetical protein [Anaerolineales bacterium]
MARIFCTLLALTVCLYACSPGVLFPESPPPSIPTDPPASDLTSVPIESTPTSDIIPVSTTEVLPPPKLIATLGTPHIEQGPDGAVTAPPSSTQGCMYQWAYEDLPELSGEFLVSIQGLQPEAQASAFAFGENCVREDGTTTFIPMETDFNVTLQVADLSNEAELGDWVVKVMQIIENIPPDQIAGPRPGRVSMIFQANAEQVGINFYIDQYHALPAGLSSAEIYQALQAPQ